MFPPHHLFEARNFTWFMVIAFAFGIGSKKVRIIKTESGIYSLSNAEIADLVLKGERFMDISEGQLTRMNSMPRAKLPRHFSVKRRKLVRKLITKIAINKVENNLKMLTIHRTRYYKSRTGNDAANWIFNYIKSLTKNSSMKITLRKIVHQGWPQNSIICRIENHNVDYDSNIDRLILSAHLDSINQLFPQLMPAPGADDDGSGVVTQLEVLRLIAKSKIKLNRPIEFIFFAAEEGGLLGSQQIVRYYQENKISAFILHIDMDGFVKKGSKPGIGLIMDNTDPLLNRILKRLITEYSSLPVKETQCGYACSDHYSWHIAGYQAAALFEGTFQEINPFIHSVKDNIDQINFKHLAEFIKVSLAFALHMTDPNVDYL